MGKIFVGGVHFSVHCSCILIKKHSDNAVFGVEFGNFCLEI